MSNGTEKYEAQNNVPFEEEMDKVRGHDHTGGRIIWRRPERGRHYCCEFVEPKPWCRQGLRDSR